MKLRLVITLSFFFQFWLLLDLCANEEANHRLPEKMEVDDLGFFNRVGIHYDCYFTLEELMAPNLRRSLVQGTEITKLNEALTPGDLVKVLRLQLKGFSVYSSPKSPSVIHIVDERLMTLDGYKLNRKVDISVTGSPEDLLVELSRQIGGIQSPQVVPIRNGVWFSDLRTVLKVEASAKDVRATLTDFVPLAEYNRLLWHAETINVPRPSTSVAFRGPITPNSRGVENAWKVGHPDFAAGQRAFFQRGSEGDTKAVEEAIVFIETRLKAQNPTQIRWAMLFLGKKKAEDGLSILLRNIDYRYTNCPLIEESFPAVKALVEYGPLAARQAYFQVQGETDPLRMDLYMRVILAVEGLEMAKKTIKRLIERLDDPIQEKRIKDALAKWK